MKTRTVIFLEKRYLGKKISLILPFYDQNEFTYKPFEPSFYYLMNGRKLHVTIL